MNLKKIPGENGEPDRYESHDTARQDFAIVLPAMKPGEEQLHVRVDTIRDIVVPYELEDQKDVLTAHFQIWMQQWANGIFGLAMQLNPRISPGTLTVNLRSEVGKRIGTLSADFKMLQGGTDEES